MKALLWVMLVAVLAAACSPAPGDAAGPAPADPAPAPHTVFVAATVQQCAAHETHYACTVRIDTVYAYGAGMRPLAAGSLLDVHLRAALLPAAADPATMLRADHRLDLTLRHQTGAGTTRWDVRRVH